MTSRVPEGNTSTPGDVSTYNATTGKFEIDLQHHPPERTGRVRTLGIRTEHALRRRQRLGRRDGRRATGLGVRRAWISRPASSSTGARERATTCSRTRCWRSTPERASGSGTIRSSVTTYLGLRPATSADSRHDHHEERDAQGHHRASFTKMGLTFVLDRDTGKPIFPVVDLPVPPSTVPGEQASATQPLRLLPQPLTRLQMHESDITDITPKARAHVLRTIPAAPVRLSLHSRDLGRCRDHARPSRRRRMARRRVQPERRRAAGGRGRTARRSTRCGPSIRTTCPAT